MLHSVFGGSETAWQSWGKNGPRVLLIHCSLAHSGAWHGIGARLADSCELRALDLPGHGGSGPWNPEMSYQEQSVEMALGVLRDWGEGPVHVVGHSFGGTVALRLAVEHPEMVASLALYEPVFFAAGLRAFPELQAEHDAEMGDFERAFAAGDMDTAARSFLSIWGDGRSWEKMPEVQRRGFAERIHLIDAIRDTNYGDPAGMLEEGGLAALTCPVLLMEGARSPGIIARVNDALQAKIPGAERRVIEGAGHMGPVTHAGDVARALASFLGV